MRSRLVNVTACGVTIRPPLPSAANAVKTWLISSASCTPSDTSLTLSAGARASANLKNPILAAVSGYTTSPTRSTWGATSLSSSSHFPLIDMSQFANPVRLPLGRASLLTKPEPTGSPTLVKNNRQSADFRLNNLRHQISIGDQHVRCQADQFHKDGACSTGIRAGKANINEDIAALVPTQLCNACRNAATCACAAGSVSAYPISTPM